jgi:hypothetical protein
MQHDECVLQIPKMDNSITQEYIKKIFSQLGTVKQINEVPHAKYKKIFVHMSLDNPMHSAAVKTLLTKHQSIKIVHDMPWYWTCHEYVKPIHGPNPNIMAEL